MNGGDKTFHWYGNQNCGGAGCVTGLSGGKYRCGAGKIIGQEDQWDTEAAGGG